MKIFSILKSVTLVCAMGFAGIAAAGEPLGSTTSDGAAYEAKFVLTNSTGNATVAYELKWGNGEWKKYKLKPNEARSHQIPIRDGKYPTPHIRFDVDTRTGKIAKEPYKLEGYKVGYDGYTAGPPKFTVPKKYEFKTIGDHTIDLLSEN